MGDCRHRVEYATMMLTLKVTLADLYRMSKMPVKTQLQYIIDESEHT